MGSALPGQGHRPYKWLALAGEINPGALAFLPLMLSCSLAPHGRPVRVSGPEKGTHLLAWSNEWWFDLSELF